MNKNTLGSVMKKLRIDRNLTQEELAKELNVTRQAVSIWERDKSLPDIEKVIEITEFFDVSMNELLIGEIRGMGSMVQKSNKIIWIVITVIGIVLSILVYSKLYPRQDIHIREYKGVCSGNLFEKYVLEIGE